MIGVVGGLVAAVCFAFAGITAAISGRRIGATFALAWVNLVSAAYVVPLAAVVEGVPHPRASSVVWVVAYGVAISVALLTAFRAMTIGPIGLIAPVFSTEGAIAAVGGVLLGDHLAGATGAALAVCVVGVMLAGLELGPAGAGALRGGEANAFWIALGGAFLFGFTLLASSRAVGIGPLTTVAVGRLFSVAIISWPILVRERWRRPTGAWRLVVVNGLFDLVGFTSFIVASRHGVAVPAVLASQYASLSVVVGYVVFHERLRRSQWVGVALTVIGTAVVAGTGGG